MKVSLIAAVAKNGVIGRDNDLPWKIRDDMRFFVATTRGHTVIMGRLNFDSMGRPLPKRRNIVVSRNASLVLEGCETVTSVEAALRLAASAEEEEAFIIGGAQIYQLALPFAHTIYRTRVLAEVAGDIVFPAIDESEWEVAVKSEFPQSEENEHAFIIEELTRTSTPQSYLESLGLSDSSAAPESQSELQNHQAD